MKLKDSIKFVKGIGEARAKLYEKIGVRTAEDMLYYLPRTIEDRSTLKTISNLMDGETVCVKAGLVGMPKTFRTREKVTVTQATVSDGSNLMKVAWFNAPYITTHLKSDTEFIFYGKVTYRGNFFEMTNPVTEGFSKASRKFGGILPVYPLTSGLNQTSIRSTAGKVLSSLTEFPPDPLAPWILSETGFPSLSFALSSLHIPKSAEDFENARRRLAFDELFMLQVGIMTLSEERKNFTAIPIKNVKCIEEFAKSLPFELTSAQKRVINEISADLLKSVPMNRLIQGDVGSGKTIVAAAAMYAAAMSGHQAVLMAPTEILAIQHFKNLKNLFSKFGFNTALLIGAMTSAEKKAALSEIKSGKAQIIIGTHALISDNVEFKDPALVITDEQHRFGVRQRTLLTEKGYGAHTLVMTATPIPRTLSLILYGDLDISVIDSLPPGRKPIKTYGVSEGYRKRIYDFAKKEIKNGRQIYIVCPLVEESETLSAKAASRHADELKTSVFAEFKVELLHGKLKAGQRKEIMERFSKGETDALVATTVIEVGVDVPNATLMIIENAERFGLSQLHQLRGRIGRGQHQSYCIMIGKGGQIAEERMKIMCQTSDGFKISEKDLELRGPGEFFGIRQHGLPELKCANLTMDMDLLLKAKDLAAKLLARDPALTLPENLCLRNKIKSRFAEVGENGILN